MVVLGRHLKPSAPPALGAKHLSQKFCFEPLQSSKCFVFVPITTPNAHVHIVRSDLVVVRGRPGCSGPHSITIIHKDWSDSPRQSHHSCCVRALQAVVTPRSVEFRVVVLWAVPCFQVHFFVKALETPVNKVTVHHKVGGWQEWCSSFLLGHAKGVVPKSLFIVQKVVTRFACLFITEIGMMCHRPARHKQ